MANHILAKILGWAQFGVQLFSQVAQQVQPGGAPHGAFSWITLLSSLGVAVGVHAAASTDGKQ